MISPLTNLPKTGSQEDIDANAAAIALKADQSQLDLTNTAVHTKADATTVSNNVALISALQSGKADQSSLTSTDATVGAHTTSEQPSRAGYRDGGQYQHTHS